MPGVKRKASFATPDTRPTKLAKRTTSHRAARSSTSVGRGEISASAPPALRKASTLTLEDKEAAASLTLSKKASSKKISTTSKPSLTKKASSVVIEGGTVTTVVPLKSGSSIGETSLTSKESLKKAASITKSLSKTASVRSGPSEPPAATAPPLPPGGLLEVAISFDTTGSMYGVLEEVRAKVKDLAQRLQADIPGIRIAVIAHGDYCDVDKYIVKWIDFGSTLPELCDFVSKVESTFGGDGPECYELVLKRAREELSWTPGSQRVLVMIGDDEPHKVGYKYGGKTYNIDWRKECASLKDMGAKVYGVQSGHDSGATKFFSQMAKLTDGHHVNLKNFSSIFDFLMMICYREGNPDMIPVYASEIRARHVGGIARDIEALAKTFGADKAPKTTKPKGIKAVKHSAVKPKPSKKPAAKKAAKPDKGTKKAKKGADKGKAKKGIPKTSVKKIKGKTVKRKPKKKTPKKKKKPLRERLNDAKFISGPLSKLTWSKWVLAVADKRPLGYSNARFKRCKKIRWEHMCIKQQLFDSFSPCIIEVGAKFPEKARTKVYVLYFKPMYEFSSRLQKRCNALTVVKTSSEHKNMSRLIRDEMKIFIRRATGSEADIKGATKYLHKFDYAWGWKRRTSRKLEKNGIVLSSDE